MSQSGSRRDVVEDGRCSVSSVLTGHTHGKATRRLSMGAEHGKLDVVGDGRQVRDAHIAGDDVLEMKRRSLLAEKHIELEEVFDRHDTLIREVFHMENFRMMLAFDPQEAKAENSRVFQEYKSKYDLLEKTESGTGQARKTRRAHTERRQIMSTPSISAPLPLSPIRSAITQKDIRSPKSAKGPTSQIWDILVHAHARDKVRGAKDKQKEKAGGVFDAEDGVGVEGGDPKVSQGVAHRKSPSKSHPGPQRRVALDSSAGLVNGKGKHLKGRSNSVVARRSERQKAMGTAVSGAESVSVSVQPVQSDTHVTPSKRPAQQVPDLAEPPKFKIKRIKLIVRRPPPIISHPLQRPPKPKHGSLYAFLSSYESPFEKVIEDAALERQIKREAIMHERAFRLRQEGRFIPSSDEVTESLVDLRSTSLTPKRTTRDIWDDVVAAVAVAKKIRSRRTTGRAIAGQIASKVQAYWDGREAKKDKLRLQEERRLRVLAKNTIRMVTNEWKKAVFHIREKERLRFEEEERKRGHEHLDAILNQSGYILETQQGDLLRSGHHSRSRSHSAGASAMSDDEDEDEHETDEESEDEGEEGGGGDDETTMQPSAEVEDEPIVGDLEGVSVEGGEDEVEGDEDVDDEEPWVQTSMLLGGHSPTLQGSIPTEDDQDDQPDTAHPDEHAYAEIYSSSRQTSPSVATPNMITDAVDEGVSPSLDKPPLVYTEETGVETHTQANGVELPSKLSSSEPASIMDVIEKSLDANRGIVRDVDEVQEVETGSTELSQSIETLKAALEAKRRTKEDAGGDSDDEDEDVRIPAYLKSYAVAPVDWDPSSRITPPLLLRGVLRPYQQAGLEWLASLHVNFLNGILADEMGLGKTIQTIALLAHLACDRGIWGPHLIIVPTSVLLNWEMEFKKFLPGFKILSYHGSTKRRKELRQGWNDKHHFNVCITSYTLASRDAHIFKRKPWYYMILDEAHMIKNFKSNRWNTLLMFRSFRRLLLTGTPLQNNLTELWALLKFLMSGSNFANLKEFGEWFSNPLEKAIEMGNVMDDETMQRVTKLHTVLRPYLLRRLKRDVEKELPSKFEHLVLCPLSKRQRFLYDEFMSRAQTQDALQSGVYQKIANVLMQLRKVCNHPDLFEVRPIVTSFAMSRSAVADFEIKELLVRRRLFCEEEERVNLGLLGLQFIGYQETSGVAAMSRKRLEATTSQLTDVLEMPGEPPPHDTRTAAGYRQYTEYLHRVQLVDRWTHIGYLNHLRCNMLPIYSRELLTIVRSIHKPILPLSFVDTRSRYLETCSRLHAAVHSYEARAATMASYIDRFAFVTPPVVALDMPRIAFSGCEQALLSQPLEFDQILHRASVKLQIAFPDPSLLQYDCGKLQELNKLLRKKKAGGHRVLIFTQMTRILDILEIFLNFHGYLYLRLDGATKIEDRQYITERFNADERVFCFISSSRSGGVGINLTGADTVIFYDSDFNPQMDRQCEDRAHRIGQIRDVHIYRFVSQHTVEEAMLRKANQKRSLDDLVIQKGEFDWRSLFNDETALTKALEEFEDTEDVEAAALAAREEIVMGDADEEDFADDGINVPPETVEAPPEPEDNAQAPQGEIFDEPEEQDDGGTTIDYMVAFVKHDYDYFKDWRI